MNNVIKKEIEIKGKEWESILDNSFKKQVKNTKVDGFRKGKCPKNIFLQKFGIESLFMDASDEALQVAYKKVLEDENVVPVCEPGVEIKDINKDLIKLEFTIITRPEVKLGKYKNLGIKKDKVDVTKEEVEKEEARIASRYAEIVIKENGEVLEGNTAVIDFKGYVDGKELEGGSGNDFPLEIGSHSFIPGFEEGLVGLKVGDKKTLNLKFPEEYTEELKGKDVKFDVTIKEIKERVLPEFTKEFFEDLGYDDITTKKEFDDKVKQAIVDRKTKEADDKYLDDVIKAASDNLQVEINPEIIDDEVRRNVNRMSESFKAQGISIDMYLQYVGKTMDELKESLKPEAIQNIKARYLLEEVAQAEDINPTEKDVEKYAEEEATKYEMEKAEFLNLVGGMEIVKHELRMRKAMDLLAKEDKGQ